MPTFCTIPPSVCILRSLSHMHVARSRTAGKEKYAVIGAEGQFYVLCHPVSALDDVAGGLGDWMSLGMMRQQSNTVHATGPTADEDSYCHALGTGSLVWTLAR